MTSLKLVLLAVLLAALGLFMWQGLPGRGPAPAATTADRQAYWFGRYAFVTTVMLSGLGPQFAPPPQMLQKMAPAAGLDPQDASMPGMTMVAGVYAGGDPRLSAPDPADMATMRWDSSQMDKTLTPAAQGYTLLKITAKRFHLDYHESPMERFAAIMMIPQAKALVKLLERMLTEEGAFAPLGPDGRPLPEQATAQDQIAALWGLSSFFLAAADPGDDYFAKAYRKFVGMGGGMMGTGQGQTPSQQPMPSGMIMRLPVDGVDALDLMNQAFQAVHGLLDQALTPAEQALAIEALGWFAVASDVSRNALNRTLHGLALQDLQTLADRLAEAEKPALADRALAVYGLSEAARITGNPVYEQAALEAFSELEALWDSQAGVYATSEGAARYVYTPFTVGAVLAGLNAVRLFGPAEPARLAVQRFQTFFERAVIASGLMRATGYPMMVPPAYRKREPAAHFTHPSLKSPAAAGQAPVYASEVVYEDGRWTVTDGRFDAAQAMFLANMSVLPHGERTDGFLPLERLTQGKRR